MRYVIAIISALICAAIAFVFFADPVATWVVAQQRFESSDDVENLNQLVFMAVNLVGLMIGWTIGWALGGPIEKRAARDET
jgi:fructose-specific phosphotransferase system IIC component